MTSMLQQAAALEWSSLSPVCIFDDECPARQYLRFAVSDIEGGSDDRSCVNAVSNAKRALHLRVGSLVEAYGGRSLFKKLSTFPERLAFCHRCGIISPSVLRRLNAMRNDVEHEYYVPTSEESQTFVDIVALFLEATSWLVYKFPADLELASDVETGFIRIRCVPGSGSIHIEGFGPSQKTSFTASACQEEVFIPWVRLSIEKAKQSQVAGN